MSNRTLKRAMAALMVAALILPALSILTPVNAQTMSIAISPTSGPVGSKITVTGTIVSYNGDYKIFFDANADGTLDDPGEVIATDTASGYAVSKEITVPNAYSGGRIVQLKDVLAGTTANAYFSVQTSYLLKTDPSVNYEGGPFTLNATVTGGINGWSGSLDLRFRVKDPDGTELTALTRSFTNLAEVACGKFMQLYTIGPGETNLVKWGTYTALLDWDDNGLFDESARQGVQSATFTVRISDKAEYGRTATVNVKIYVESGVSVGKWQIINPAGTVVKEVSGPWTGPTWVSGSWTSNKDSTVGSYTVKFIKPDDTVYKSQTFTLKVAAFSIEYIPADLVYDLGPIDVNNKEIQRTYTVKAKFYVKYPSGAYAVSADISTGFTVSVFYNTTKVADITLDPLTAFETATNKWVVSWKIPKNAVEGINYGLNVTVNSITDSYGNIGPEEYASTGSVKFFKVVPAVLSVSTPSLIYPGAGASLSRTLEARASFEVKYPDGSTRLTADDLKWVNVTIYSAAKSYTKSLASEDYSTATGLWIAKWKIPYDAPIANDYKFQVGANKIEDAYGNKGPAASTPDSAMFEVKKATLTVSNLATDRSIYSTNDQVVVSFDATYPSGDEMTKGTAKVTISGAGMTPVDRDATYDSATGKWVAKWVIPTDQPGGTYNATVKVDAIADEATPANTGPSAQKWVNFELSRIALTDVKASADSAKAAADSAKAAADAAKAMAESAKSAAVAANSTAAAAKAAAGDAKASADAAKTAAAGAKTAAEAAQSAVAGLTGVVYAAVALSLIAAIAAIIAVIQLQRKVAA
jgi:hypothetical protein